MENTPISSDRYNFLPEGNNYKFPFYAVLGLLFIEYGRPQELFSVIKVIHPGLILNTLLIFLLFRYGKKFYLSIPQSKLFIGLIILMSIHGPIATNNYWAFIVWKNTILYFIVFLGIINFVDSYSKIYRYIDTWIVINLFGALLGIINKGVIPNSAFMGDENDFSLVMNMAVPFSYFMFLEETRSIVKKIFYLISTAIFVIATVISLSRGGFIGLLAVFIYCWVKTPRKVLSTVVLLFLLGVLALTAPSKYWGEVKSITEENIEVGTGAERWYFWQMGLRMFVTNPIIGVGQGNYPWVIEQYEDPSGGYQERYHGSRQAHSIYFTILPELGIIGTLIFLAMLFYSFKDLRLMLNLEKKMQQVSFQKNSPSLVIYQLYKLRFISYAVIGALIGYLVSGIFLSVLYYPHFWILMGLLVAVAMVCKKLILEEFNLNA